ncbi:rod shape-determining protein [Enterovibrio nigricans]|uniref:Rod shape-determining protein MreB n=1 Tax=Enterovibrio nigricans DSM 22720 TaxID=1121868 RepID=A0A1T4UIB1_9GAMM|nr:rod shape-determining protein [Enterovibrio nigricans]SKA52434.1 rod shape-determining protein MreB [Enterovibrio nigricans DSM 22720]
MLSRFIYAYGNTLYIQMWSNRLRVFDGKTGRVFDEKPHIAWMISARKQKKIIAFGNKAEKFRHVDEVTISNPFSHPRSLVSDYKAFQPLLRYAISQVVKMGILKPRIQVILHPMEKVEGGVTELEKKALCDMAYNAGVKSAFVYWGEALEETHLRRAQDTLGER